MLSYEINIKHEYSSYKLGRPVKRVTQEIC